MSHTNLLNPFSTPHHENRLTWAFLVTLDYDPLLQNIFRKLVESKLSHGGRDVSNFWESAHIYTQTRWIEPSTNRLVSILLTDETTENIRTEWSDRVAVYDGVIQFKDGLTLIIENKLSHGNVWSEQLKPSRSSFSGNISDVDLHDSAICLEWSEILAEVLKYADSGIAPFSSRKICHDFLTFVEGEHPKLTPYRTFRLCGNRVEALNRRISRLVDRLGDRVNLESREGWYLFRPNNIAERIGIWAETNMTLVIKLWPAVTVRQAKDFYRTVNRTAFLNLDDWKIEPALHFSFIQRILCNATTTWSIDRYFDYFVNEQPYGQMNIADLIPLVQLWEKEGLVTSIDLDNLNELFNKNYPTLNVIPGFSVSRVWNLNKVIDLEEQGKLENHILNALKTPLDSWSETLNVVEDQVV